MVDRTAKLSRIGPGEPTQPTESIVDGRQRHSPVNSTYSPTEEHPFRARGHNLEDSDGGEFEMMDQNEPFEEIDTFDLADTAANPGLDEQNLRETIERRADLLAITLHTLISSRQPKTADASMPSSLQAKHQNKGLYKNDPFRKNLSHNSLLQLEQAITSGSQSLDQAKLATLQEIRQRLLDRGNSQSSQSGGGTNISGQQKKLGKPIVHESLYVYATDKTNGGMALAEKWVLTLQQPQKSSTKKKSTGRTSILAGVDTTGLALDPTENVTTSQKDGNQAINVSQGNQSVGPGLLEESKAPLEDSASKNLPSVLIMEDDYFQTDSQTKLKSQMETLTERSLKVAYALPMNELIENQSIQAELRWEKTKNWRPYASIKESSKVEMQIEDVGKIMVTCDYIPMSEIKAHILQDQREQSVVIEAGLRRDGMNQNQPSSKGGLFNFSGLQALSGAFTSSPDGKVPVSRPRLQSDNTAQLATFGQRLQTRIQNQLTSSNEAQDQNAATQQTSTQAKHRQFLIAQLGGEQETNKAVEGNQQQNLHKLSGDSQNSERGSLLGRVRNAVGTTLGNIINSARGVNSSSRRQSINNFDQLNKAESTGLPDQQPLAKSRTMSGNPFLNNSQAPGQMKSSSFKRGGRPRMSDLIALSGEQAQEVEGRQRVCSLRQANTILPAEAQSLDKVEVSRTKSYAEHVSEAVNRIDTVKDLPPDSQSNEKQSSTQAQLNSINMMKVSQASDLMMRLSMSRSISRQSNLHLVSEDGAVIEINSQGSLGSSPENTPEKAKQQLVSDGKGSQELKDELDFLAFDDQELANSLKQSMLATNAHSAAQQMGAPLSTRSENEEERAQRVQLQLRQLKVMTQAKIKEQEEALKAAEEASFVQLSQEGQKEKLCNCIKAEFITILKVRKVLQKSLT